MFRASLRVLLATLLVLFASVPTLSWAAQDPGTIAPADGSDYPVTDSGSESDSDPSRSDQPADAAGETETENEEPEERDPALSGDAEGALSQDWTLAHLGDALTAACGFTTPILEPPRA